jgi:hypothetical protein
VSYDDERYDRQRAERDRAEANEQGWRAVADGNSLAAIRAFAGPEAAMHYADAMAEDEPWPPYALPADLDDLVANLRALPVPADVRIRRVEDGEAEIEAVARSSGSVLGVFWAPEALVEQYLAIYGRG